MIINAENPHGCKHALDMGFTETLFVLKLTESTEAPDGDSHIVYRGGGFESSACEVVPAGAGLYQPHQALRLRRAFASHQLRRTTDDTQRQFGVLLLLLFCFVLGFLVF